jgi:hypothetical protein
MRLMDADKIKDFAVYNFEKLIVAIVILMAGFLVYVGMGKEDIMQSEDPDALAESATQVRRQIDEDHSDQIIPEREPTFDIATKQEEFNDPINYQLYATQAWDPSIEEKNETRRSDPTLVEPVDVQATGVIATLAYRSSDGLYPIADLEPADEVEVVEQQPSPADRRRQRDMEMEMMGGGMEMMEMEMMGGGMDMMEMEMMGGGTTGASGPVRKLSPENNLGMTAAATKALRSGAEQPPVPGTGYFIAGAAAIPHAEMIEAYRVALSEAAGYDPRRRDRPEYIAYEVQRADVTNKSVDELQESDWVLRDSHRKTISNAVQYWSGFAPEIVPADYRVDGITMWIPPVLLDSYESFATHPRIPMKGKRELMMEQMEREAEAVPEEETPLNPDDFEIDTTGQASRSYEMGMDMGMEMGMGMEMDYGMEGGGMGMGSGRAATMRGKPAEEDPVEYKLLRFYDFAYLRGAPRDKNIPKPGRQYVYRIRFGVNDPNFPKSPEMQPLPKTLEPDAYKRVIELAAEARQTQERDFTRWSPWSAPSKPTSLPPLDRVYVGTVKAEKARRIKLGNRRVVVESNPPKAEVVASSFKPALGVFVPTLIDATEGTVLSKKAETADVVDPITLEVKKVEDVEIKSSATIIDIEGGLPLEIVEDEEMTEPGLFLMMDSNGNLEVHQSTDDQRSYRIKSFAKERGL